MLGNSNLFKYLGETPTLQMKEPCDMKFKSNMTTKGRVLNGMHDDTKFMWPICYGTDWGTIKNSMTVINARLPDLVRLIPLVRYLW